MKLTRAKSSRSPIGLDLGDCVLKAAQLQCPAPGQPPTLIGAVALDRLNPGAPLDLNEALRLRDVLTRRGFVGRQAVVAVPGKSCLTSVLSLPPRKDGVPFDQIVRAEMAHEHRCEPDSFELAWWELPKPARSSAGTHAMAVACSHTVADETLDVLQRAGFDVVGLDIEGWAVARACDSLVPSRDDMVASVDLGWDSTTLVLLHQGLVVYERSTFGAGIRQLRKVLEQDHQYPPQVVDYLLHDIGFELDTRGKEDDWRLLSKSAGPLQVHFEHVVKELNLALDYAQSQYPSAAITRVLLMGGGAMIPGVAGHITNQIEAPVLVPRLTDVTRNAESFGELAQQPALMLAVGLARHGEAAARGKEAA